MKYKLNHRHTWLKWSITAFLLISSVFSTPGTTQGLSCKDLQFILVPQSGNCCYKIGVNNKSMDNCFQQINLNVSPEEFVHFTGLSGWRANEVSQSEYNVRPFAGFIPFGYSDIATFCVQGNPSSQLVIQWDHLCLMEGCDTTIMIQGCQPKGHIEGYVYVDIACEGKTYNGQPGIADWTTELYDSNGDLFAATLTNSQGYYKFFDLPLENYIVKVAQKPLCWTPKIPVNGQLNVRVEEDKISRADFGNCPVCPCDSLNFDVQFVEEGPDSISYYISLFEHYEPCKFRSKFIEVTVDSGTLFDFHPINNDLCCTETNKVCCHWAADLKPNSQSILLSHVSGLLPDSGEFILKLSVLGATKQKLTLKLLKNLNDTLGDCEKAFVFDLPRVTKKSCCPNNSFMGPELICNGEFSIKNPGPNYCITSDYLYYTGPAKGSGSYTVGNSQGVSAANGGNWICMGLTGPSDHFMIVDGSTNNLRIWEQIIPVIKNREYQFSINLNCIGRVNPGKDPQVDIFFNNQKVNTLIAPYKSGWKNLTFCWNSRDTNQVKITIHTNHNIGNNDFALDGISLKSCIPDSLCCDPANFEAMYYTINGKPVHTLLCGDTLKADCKTSNVSLSGNFTCANNNCLPQMMTAILTKPDGSTVPVSLNWPMPYFVLNIPGSDMSTSGYYYLSIQAVCGVSICRCDFVICVDCCIETFDSEVIGSKSSWQTINADVQVISSSPPNLTNVIRGRDFTKASWMYNTVEYSGNWIQNYKGCLCFDIRYDPGATTNPPTGDRTLYIFNGNSPITSSLRAVFVTKTQIGNNWERICVPIAAAGTSLPSNSYGQWQMSSGSNSSFNSLITNVNGVGFSLDFASGGSPNELLYLDNICLEKCLDSCYCGPHKILYSIGKNPLLEKNCGDTLFVPGTGTILPINFNYEFSCIGQRCDTPKIEWTLTGPGNFITQTGIGSATNPTANRFIDNSTFVNPGLYTLTIIGKCGDKICPCILYFDAEGFKCCQDSIATQILANSLVSTEADVANCKIKLSLGNVPPCMKLTSINWGDGQFVTGSYGTADMIMHNYNTSGNYTVIWVVNEYDQNGKICNEFIFRKQINLKCECDCKGLDWAEYYHVQNQPLNVACNNSSPIVINCKKYGPAFLIHGDLSCTKNGCQTDTAHWELVKQGNITPILSNTNINLYPHFDIIIPWSQFAQGLYTLKVYRYCNGIRCECNFNIYVEDCICSCDLFDQNMASAFNVGSTKQDCKKLFKPVDLCPQDVVHWTVNSQSVSGISVGNTPFPYTFTSNGTFDVCMIVTRTDAFGTICRDSICRKLFIKCNSTDGYFCNPDSIKNGGFEKIAELNPVLEVGHKNNLIENWEVFNNPGSLGLAVMYSEPGGLDQGSISMIGNQNNFSGIVQLAPIIEANLQAQRYRMHLSYNFINYLDNDPNEPELEFRLQKNKDRKDADDKVIFVKRKDMREDLEGKLNTWMLVDTSFNLDFLEKGNNYYLVICLRNKSANEFSFIGLDNISICIDPLDATGNPDRKRFDAIVLPNPSKDIVQISWFSEYEQVHSLAVVNSQGTTLLQNQVEQTKAMHILDMSKFKPGIYFVHLYGPKGILKSLKLVKL